MLMIHMAQQFMKRRSLWLGVACSLAVALCASCDGGKETATQQEAPEIKTFPIIRQEVTDTGEWFGYLRGKEDTDIHPHVSGFLISQDYEDGSYVEADQVLFHIDPSIFEAELELAKANLSAAEAAVASAKASAEQAQKDVDRYTPLVGNGAVSEKDMSDATHRLRSAQAAVKAAEAEVQQCRAAVDKAKINLAYTEIRAPYSGIIGTSLASIGDLVSPATKLANITSINPIRFEFSINSDRLISVFRKYGDMNDIRQNADTMPPVQLVLEDGTVFPLAGKLTAMESKVGDTGLINIQGEVSNPEGLLRGGMPVRVRIPLEKKEALLVPKEALRSVLRSDFIIVVDKESHPHMVPVEVGGVYEVPVHEQDGYVSEQQMVAVSGARHSLQKTLQEYGYSQPTEALVVVDEQNAVRAMNISSANSRLAADAAAQRGKISPVPFSFKPAPSAAILAAAAAGEGADKPKENKKAAPTLPAVPVKVAPLLRQDVEVVDEWFGSLRGVEETEIRPQVSGFLMEQCFRDGALVKKGDKLFSIDPASYEAAVSQAEANCAMAEAQVEQAQARLDLAKQDFERYSKLASIRPGAVADKTLTDAQSAIKTSEAEVLKATAAVKQMQAALQLAKINLQYTTITAPFDGRVGIHKPSIGALVSPTDPQPLVTLSSVDPIRVDFQVSGKGALKGIGAFETAGDTRGGDERPGFDIVLEDGSIYPVQGHVVSADNALSKTTGTLRVVGHVQNVDGSLRSGMPVRVRSSLEPLKGAYLVPARAPLSANGRDVLVLLRADGTPDMLPIVKGALVTVPGPGEQGMVPQPMQIVDVDRQLLIGMLLAYTKAPSVEALVLQGAGVEDWQGLVLKSAGVSDWRALLEKKAGQALPDDAPVKAGVEDWAQLALKQSGADSFRDLALSLSGAKDELELIARGQGVASPLELLLKRMGYEDLSQVQVVTEGSLMAAQAYQLNQAAGARVNKLSPSPFRYTPPRTVVDSVTADEASQTDVEPIGVK